jgi:hypothetical protein
MIKENAAKMGVEQRQFSDEEILRRLAETNTPFRDAKPSRPM